VCATIGVSLYVENTFECFAHGGRAAVLSRYPLFQSKLPDYRGTICACGIKQQHATSTSGGVWQVLATSD
jgi:hypothetical protein